MKKGFTVINLLITLVIISAIALLSINTLKGVSTSKDTTQSVKQETDKRIEEIENLRKQSIKLQQDLLNRSEQ